MSTNPVEKTFSSPALPHPPPISSIEVPIAGLKCTIYGLSELPTSSSTTSLEVSVLYLLHPRLQSRECMTPFAAHLIHSYYNTLENPTTQPPPLPQIPSQPPSSPIQPSAPSSNTTSANHPSNPPPPTSTQTPKAKRGLIALSFDARNHGSRLISPLSNEAWRQGNPRHAIDMFSSYAGTAMDTSLLIDHLESHLFPPPSNTSKPTTVITQNIVLGVSLGGHAAWHLLLSEPRVDAAIITIGCPDYISLMSDRARLSRRPSFGKGFLGSSDFPRALVDAVRRKDPVAKIWGPLSRKHTWTDVGLSRSVPYTGGAMSEEQIRQVRPLMEECFGGKRVLNLSGGKDKMVARKFTEPLMKWLREATGRGGWFEDGGCVIVDRVFEGCGHEVVPEMVREMELFVTETVTMGGSRGGLESRRREIKL